MTPDNLRISYTALSLWERHDLAGLIDYFNGVRFEPTAQMLEGQKYDGKACADAVVTKRLIPEFGWYDLKDPQPQLKLEAKLVSASGIPFTLVGVLDIYDAGTIWELKTGRMSSINYARTKQTRIYTLLCHLNNLPVNQIRITRYDQYNNKTDVHIVRPGRYMISSTLDELQKTVADIQQFVATMKGDTYGTQEALKN